MTFRLTYSTMFNPPPELHEQFDAALEKIRGSLGENHDHFINGADVPGDMRVNDTSPINTEWVLGEFPVAGIDQVDAAVAAAKAALPTLIALRERRPEPGRDTNPSVAGKGPAARAKVSRRFTILRSTCVSSHKRL